MPVLDLVVAAPAAAAQVTIKAVTWKGLRCVVEVDSASADLTVDVRTKPALAASSLVASVKPLEAGKASVAVAVFAPHRGAAFEACRYAIDTLKATVPIWKKEWYEDGSVWLEDQAVR